MDTVIAISLKSLTPIADLTNSFASDIDDAAADIKDRSTVAAL